MQPILEKVKANINHSFQVNHLKTDLFPSPLHFHPEIEILLVLQGTGTRFIGDSVGRFSPGELIMIGGNVPHVWYSDKPESQNGRLLDSEAVYILFESDIFGDQFWSLPESRMVLKTIEYSQRGIKLKGEAKAEISVLMNEISQASGFRRISLLFEILTKIATADGKELLSSQVVQNKINQGDSNRLNKVYQYVLDNSSRKITLDDVASIANFAKPAFCRYFKQRVNKTFIQFLNEIRVGHACRLLIKDDLPVADACFMTGFNNISYFIKQFKRQTGLTPLKYRRSVHNSRDGSHPSSS